MAPTMKISCNGSVWAQSWTDRPYWIDGETALPDMAERPDTQADVVIIGAGYTGLNAAIETAQAGRKTIVIDAQDAGYGCSTRNGGQISTSIKPSLAKLSARFGPERGRAIRREGETALQWIEDRIGSLGIDCDFDRPGRFHAAHTPQAYDQIAREAEQLGREEGIEARAIPAAEQHAYLGSDAYFGGVLFPNHASIHPGKYHRGLLRAALAAGASIVPHCAATGITRVAGGFEVQTEKGKIHARDVIVATNGYTGAASPWMQRRVIPIGSYVIATEPLPAELMDRLFPQNRIASDTCKVVYYYRPSPDRTRVLFGGRVSASETDPAVSGPKLYRDMCRIFPELSAYRLNHSWVGMVAYTFDELAHTGTHDGVHYAIVYCFSVVSMASYLGMRMGQKVLGLAEGETAFDNLPFPTRPLYAGKPWFLPPMVAWYRWRDRMEYGRAQRALGQS